jgi:sulfide dehydrogenase [flavocytochrome c] flavoprotein subunit
VPTFGRVKADLLNVIPEQRAGELVVDCGLPLTDGRWVEVDWRTMAVPGFEGLHVIGDAVLAAPGMPKSAHMANQHAEIAAAAVLRFLDGQDADREPWRAVPATVSSPRFGHPRVVDSPVPGG